MTAPARPAVPPSVLVVDDRPVVADGLAAALAELLPGPVASVSTEPELRAALTACPRVVVVPLERGGSGADLLDVAVRSAPAATALVVLAPADGPDEPRARLLRRSAVRAMVPATATVQALSDEIAKLEATRSGTGAHPPLSGRPSESADEDRLPGPEDRLLSLTIRERQVLDLLARGRSTREIADTFAISVNTVRAHINVLLHKLDVHSRLRAVALYTDVAPASSPPAAESRGG